MFENKGANYEYKINETNIANDWNLSAKSGKKPDGFNFSVEDKIVRWLVRVDTIYDIIIPDDAEVIDAVKSATSHGIFRSKKLAEMAMEFYKKSTILELEYYKVMVGCTVRGYEETTKQILKDKVNVQNIKVVIEEWDDFIDKKERRNSNDTVIFIDEALRKIEKIIEYKLYLR